MPAWRENHYLKERFHPEYPDDVQVLIHDGGPRISGRTPELIWVRVVRQEPGHFAGIVLNKPENLAGVKQGDEIRFIAAESSPHPLLATSKYLSERKMWSITPCDKCGFSELFDAPSDLIRKIFHDLPEGFQLEAFSSFCPYCGGAQIIANSNLGDFEVNKRKRWWKFWNRQD